MDVMEILKAAFKDGSLTYEQLEEKLKAQKDVNLYNLADGGYMSEEKYNRKVGEMKDAQQALQDQLTAANEQIQQFKDMDIDGIKQSVSDWQAKYEADTKALHDKMAAKETEYAAKDYLSKFDFTSGLAKDAALEKFLAQDFKLNDGVFLGADEYMKKIQEQEPGAFKHTEKQEPRIVTSSMTQQTAQTHADNGFRFKFNGVRPKKEQ